MPSFEKTRTEGAGLCGLYQLSGWTEQPQGRTEYRAGRLLAPCLVHRGWVGMQAHRWVAGWMGRWVSGDLLELYVVGVLGGLPLCCLAGSGGPEREVLSEVCRALTELN